MELKKTEQADLGNKSSLFFGIGLTIAVSLCLLAFEWKQYGGGVADLISKSVNTSEEMLEVPVTVQPPPPVPVIQQPKIVEVPDKEEIKEDLAKFDADITEEMVIAAPVVQEVAAPVEEVDEIFVAVEKSAEFPGGLKSFYEYVGKHTKYPSQARRMGVEGKVFVSFVVGKDGSLSDIQVVRGLGAGLDEEAVRVLRECPTKWVPAKQGAKYVRQRMTMPFVFKLD